MHKTDNRTTINCVVGSFIVTEDVTQEGLGNLFDCTPVQILSVVFAVAEPERREKIKKMVHDVVSKSGKFEGGPCVPGAALYAKRGCLEKPNIEQAIFSDSGRCFIFEFKSICNDRNPEYTLRVAVMYCAASYGVADAAFGDPFIDETVAGMRRHKVQILTGVLSRDERQVQKLRNPIWFVEVRRLLPALEQARRTT